MLTRRGITLLEVLISMFVLLIGLLGVAALIPAGRSQIMHAVKTDYATTVGRAAVRDLKARGMLNPTDWRDASNTAAWQPKPVVPGPFDPDTKRPFVIGGVRTSQAFIAIDPLGCAAGFGAQFPAGAPATLSLARIYPSPSLSTTQLADPVFRCSDDLAILPGAGKDMPPIQQMIGGTAKRSSEGNYSWLATIATDPTSSALNAPLIVSLVTFYKRDLASASVSEVPISAGLAAVWTGEVILDNLPKPVRAGQWFMLAGNVNVPDPVPPHAPLPTMICRWYRVVGASPLRGGRFQDVTVAGPDFDVTAANVTAWIFDGVLGVNEKNMSLEIN